MVLRIETKDKVETNAKRGEGKKIMNRLGVTSRTSTFLKCNG